MTADRIHPSAEKGRPLGAASGGDVGFWDRLGHDEGGLPAHLPIGVNANGQGPEDDAAAYTYTCWCGDVECPLSLALGHAWAAGRRVTPPAENAAGCGCDPTDAALVEVEWQGADGAWRMTCGLCGATRVLSPGERGA